MQRLSAKFEAIVPAPADAAWDLLRDWVGLLKWWPSDAPFPLLSCEAIGDPAILPFGRRVGLPDGGVGEEYLFLADTETRRLYYRLTNGTLPGILNYVATTTVDEVQSGQARMSFSSTFDAPEAVDPVALEAMLVSVYSAIARGIGQTIASAGADR